MKNTSPMITSTLAPSSILDSVELFATRMITDEFSEKLVFHDIKHIYGVVQAIEEIGSAEKLSAEEMEITKIAGWFNFLGFRDLDSFEKTNNKKSLFKNCMNCSSQIARDYLQKKGHPKEKTNTIIEVMSSGGNGNFIPTSKLANVLSDATTAYLGQSKSRKNIELLYQEFLLTDTIEDSKSGFYQNAINYVNEHNYLTDYAKENFNSTKNKLVQKLEKRKKALDQNEDLVLKKELDISDAEFKKLKKNLKNIQGRDDRGIQTMFRTTSKNHYTLNEMVDKKANIMISINAIIISVILGRIISHAETDVFFCIHNAPLIVLLLVSTASIFNAVLAIRPAATHGEFTEEEIRNKKGNLLYFGNYHNMRQRDYEWGVLQMMNDSNYLYSTMIRDQYFLGQLLSKKYRFIRRSLGLFIVGFVLAVAAFLILGIVGETYHFGTAQIGLDGLIQGI